MKFGGVILVALLLPLRVDAAEAGAYRSLASLRQSAEAVELALAGAAQPWAEGVSLLTLNPAALGLRPGLGLGASHQFGLLESGVESLWFSMRSRGGLGHGVGLQYASMGRFERRDELGYPSGGAIQPWGLAARYGLGKAWDNRGLALGAGLGYLRQQIVDANSDLLEGSVSADWRPRPAWGTVLMLKVLGGAEGTHLEGVASGAWQVFRAQGHSLRTAVQVAWTDPGPASPGLGLVYGWRESLRVRVGFEIPSVAGYKAASGLSLGVGFQTGDYSLDAAWKDQGELGAMQSLSLSRSWGGQPAVPEALFKARELARQGKSREALWGYHRYLQGQSKDRQAWLEMAQLYEAQGRPAEAETCRQRALQLGSAD